MWHVQFLALPCMAVADAVFEYGKYRIAADRGTAVHEMAVEDRAALTVEIQHRAQGWRGLLGRSRRAALNEGRPRGIAQFFGVRRTCQSQQADP